MLHCGKNTSWKCERMEGLTGFQHWKYIREVFERSACHTTVCIPLGYTLYGMGILCHYKMLLPNHFMKSVSLAILESHQVGPGRIKQSDVLSEMGHFCELRLSTISWDAGIFWALISHVFFSGCKCLQWLPCNLREKSIEARVALVSASNTSWEGV